MKIKELKEKALNGEVSALQVLAELTEFERAIKEAKEEILNDAISEFDKYGAKSVTEFGFEISATQSGRYEYKHNPDWVKKQNELKEIESRMQLAYHGEGVIVNETTGEVTEPAIYKANKASLKFKKL